MGLAPAYALAVRETPFGFNETLRLRENSIG